MNDSHRQNPDPRRKNALVLGGILAVAIVAWNFDDWTGGGDDDDGIGLTIVSDRDEIREFRDEIREEFRDNLREELGAPDSEDGAEETAEGDATEQDDQAAGEEQAAQDAADESEVFRIEDENGRGVSIRVD